MEAKEFREKVREGLPEGPQAREDIGISLAVALTTVSGGLWEYIGSSRYVGLVSGRRIELREPAAIEAFGFYAKLDKLAIDAETRELEIATYKVEQEVKESIRRERKKTCPPLDVIRASDLSSDEDKNGEEK